ncbi:MAG: SpoIID/LytB domain-containing protein [Patescibacteria group bacterium]
MKIKSKKQNFVTFKQLIQILLLVAFVVAVSGILRLVESIFTDDEVIAKEPAESITSTLQTGYVGYGSILPLPNNPATTAQPQVLGMAFASRSASTVWQAKNVGQIAPDIKILPGRSLTFWVDFQNVGNTTWRNDDEHFIAMNVDQPAGRHSIFQHDFWSESYRPCSMLTDEVKPGQVGRFQFAIVAPDRPGQYLEQFHLVAENLIWIPGGNFVLPITVLPHPPAWQAELIYRSFEEIEIAPDDAFTFEVKFRNTGTATWYNDGDNFIALNLTGPPGRQSSFRHDFWPADYRPCKMLTDEVRPGEVGRFRFAMQVPDQPGFYFEEFNLVAENLIWIEGGYLSLPVTIKNPTTPANANPEQEDIRVGLFDSDDSFQLTANKNFKVVNTHGTIFATLVGGAQVTVTFEDNKYHLELPGTTKTSYYPVRFIPVKAETIFEIVSFKNATAWNSEVNDNRFRGILEINHAAPTEKTWIINELPLELYLRGVAEAGNENPEDYLKALVIAERTYAQYHINTGTKHADENFTVDATYDQVYRGYGFEERAHVIVELIEETEGMVVTYDDEVVVTPYFSRTDGRTRSWEEVWSGDPKPWLITVPDPACEGMVMLGHGVGMSAYGARAMAEDGSTYDEILKYYYTGIEIADFY